MVARMIIISENMIYDERLKDLVKGNGRLLDLGSSLVSPTIRF